MARYLPLAVQPSPSSQMTGTLFTTDSITEVFASWNLISISESPLPDLAKTLRPKRSGNYQPIGGSPDPRLTQQDQAGAERAPDASAKSQISTRHTLQPEYVTPSTHISRRPAPGPAVATAPPSSYQKLFPHHPPIDTAVHSTSGSRQVLNFSLRRHGIDPNALAEAAATSEPVTPALRLPIPPTRSRSVWGHVTSDNQAQSNRAADDAQSRNPYRQGKSVESNDQASPFVSQKQPTNPYRQGKSVESKDQALPSVPRRTRETDSSIFSLAAPKPNSNTTQNSSPRQPNPSTVVKSPSKTPSWPAKFPDQNAIREAADARRLLTRKEKISLDRRLELLIRGKKTLSDRLKRGAWLGDHVGTFAEIKQVLSEGASMRFTNEDALTCELQHSSRFEVLELLLSFGANVNDYPNFVHSINLKPDKAFLHLSLHYGADRMIHYAADPDIPKPHSEWGSPLYIAAFRGQFDLVKLFLDYKADVTFDNPGTHCGTALNAACRKKNYNIVKTLLEHGADPNLKAGKRSYNPTQTTIDRGGEAPMARNWLGHISFEDIRETKQFLRLLKEHGAEDPELDEYLKR